MADTARDPAPTRSVRPGPMCANHAPVGYGGEAPERQRRWPEPAMAWPRVAYDFGRRYSFVMPKRLPQTSVKQCTKCGVVKPLSAEYFSPRPSRPLGFFSRCRECVAQTDAERKRRSRKFGPGERRQHAEPGMQRCTKCGATYPATLEYFGPKPRCSNGLASWCRECARAKARDGRAKIRQSVDGKQKIKKERKRYLESERGKKTKQASSRVHNAKRRQRKTGLPFEWSNADWLDCLRAFGGACAYCGSPNDLHQDHFIPLSHPDCPGTVVGNMVPACEPCNLSKGAKHPRSWVKDEATFARVDRTLRMLRGELQAEDLA